MFCVPGSNAGSNLKVPPTEKLALAATEPEIIILPDNEVLPNKLLLPI